MPSAKGLLKVDALTPQQPLGLALYRPLGGHAQALGFKVKPGEHVAARRGPFAGTDAQRERFLAPLARGEAGGFSLTDDAAAMIAALCWPGNPMVQTVYSPYQHIEITAQKTGLPWLLASGSYHQRQRHRHL